MAMRSLPRLEYTLRIADSLNLLAAIVKTRSTLGLNDAAHTLETLIANVLNEIYDLRLRNLNSSKLNYPAADLADRSCRRAFQITVQQSAGKIRSTVETAARHKLTKDFHHLTIFFLLPKAPKAPKGLPKIKGLHLDILDIAGLVKATEEIESLPKLRRIAEILEGELGMYIFPHNRPSVRIQPKLLACFQEEHGEIIYKKNGGGLPPSIRMDLWVDGAPTSTKSINFSILDKRVRGREWTLQRDRRQARPFLADDLCLYGTVDIWARGFCDDGTEWFIRSSLFEALVNNYGRKPKRRDIAAALIQIRNN
jgi:hypothetical protein